MLRLAFVILLNAILLAACRTPTELVKLEPSVATMDDYLSARRSLMQRDSALYFDAEVRLSAEEKQLDNYLIRLRRRMNEAYRANHFFPPARNFYASKKHMEQTELFQLLRRMPKGGILHLHSGAMGDARWVIERAIALPEMHVFWEPTNEQYCYGQLHAYAPGQAPTGFQPVTAVNQMDPDFPTKMLDLLTFDASIDRDSVDIWGEFEYVFQRISGFITYEKVGADYLIHGSELLIADNIQHAEFRTFFGDRYYNLDGKLGETFYIQLLEEVERATKELDPAFTFNLIQQSLRFFDRDQIRADVLAAHRYRQDHPRWIRGFDLVAEEDAGHATLYHVEELLLLDSLRRATGVELPLYLHDGESDWASTANLYDAVLLGTKRIGHGFNLFRFPHLLELVREKNICVEVNPLSNQILGYIRDLRLHPASTLLRRGVDCVISSDDPLIFDYQGLSYDFWSVFLAWELDLAALKKLSQNSLTHAAMTDAERRIALMIWEQRWQEFVRDALAQINE